MSLKERLKGVVISTLNGRFFVLFRYGMNTIALITALDPAMV